MNIAGYLKTSLIEWPGKITSVIFTPGCNFRCPFCHNADLVKSDKVTKIQSFKEENILTDLKSRKKWIDAVVITGGEPTLQKDLPEFLKKLKEMGFLVMLHTNGTDPKTIKELLINGLTDYICMDIKGNFDEYQNFTNVKTQISNIKSSMKIIAESGVGYEFRTTVVPGLHDMGNLTELAKQIVVIANFSSRRRRLKSATTGTKWYLQQFRPMNTFDKEYLKIKPFSKEQIEVFQKELQKIIPQTLLRGV